MYFCNVLFQVQQVQEVPEDEDEGRQVPPVAEDQAAAERDAGDPGDEPLSLSGAGGVIIIPTKDLVFPSSLFVSQLSANTPDVIFSVINIYIRK